jgi:hypothetical protein
MQEDADAVPELIEEYQLMWWTVRAEQAETVLDKALAEDRPAAVRRWHRICAEATRHCLDLLTR